MSKISSFCGIRITMEMSNTSYPPHFQAEFLGDRILIGIEKAVVLAGYIPDGELKLVLGWCVLRRAELMRDWALLCAGQPLLIVEPLWRC